MTLTLNTIKPAKGAIKKKKRLGRGNASGHGTYSTRGLKGQKSRTGGRNKLKRLGFKKILQNIPKVRGFKSGKVKNQVVNLMELNKYFSVGMKINPLNLFKVGLIDSTKLPVKILSQGELKVKNLLFSDVKVSQSAQAQIEKMAGKIEVRSKK